MVENITKHNVKLLDDDVIQDKFNIVNRNRQNIISGLIDELQKIANQECPGLVMFNSNCCEHSNWIQIYFSIVGSNKEYSCVIRSKSMCIEWLYARGVVVYADERNIDIDDINNINIYKTGAMFYSEAGKKMAEKATEAYKEIKNISPIYLILKNEIKKREQNVKSENNKKKQFEKNLNCMRKIVGTKYRYVRCVPVSGARKYINNEDCIFYEGKAYNVKPITIARQEIFLCNAVENDMRRTIEYLPVDKVLNYKGEPIVSMDIKDIDKIEYVAK